MHRVVCRIQAKWKEKYWRAICATYSKRGQSKMTFKGDLQDGNASAI